MPANLTHSNAALRVCIDKVQDDGISGRVFSRRLTAPLPFSDIGSMLLKLEAVLDRQNFPQAFQRTRTFTAGKHTSVPAAASLDEGMSAEEVAAATGALATFVIYVITRRSTTWQGRVDWLDGSPPEAFSSVLELIKLIDQHLFT